MNFAIPGLPKKMNLTSGVRSRHSVVSVYKFGFSGSEFDGEFEHRFGLVGSGRNFELRCLAAVSIGGCNSRLRVVTVILTANLESASNSGSYRVLLVMSGYFWSDLRFDFGLGGSNPSNRARPELRRSDFDRN